MQSPGLGVTINVAKADNLFSSLEHDDIENDLSVVTDGRGKKSKSNRKRKKHGVGS